MYYCPKQAMKFTLILILLITFPVGAQNQFRLNDASKKVDVNIDVGHCDNGNCGPVAVKFYRKGAPRSFQTIKLDKTNMWDAAPKANVTRRYDDQSVLNFNDFNFDGQEDVAICDGTGGGYGMPSYKIYLYSKQLAKFVYSASFTKLTNNGMNLGMVEIDKNKQILYRFSKSGCCWHQTEGFDVISGRPRKIYEFTEEVLMYKPEVVEITTAKFIKGKWRTWIKHAKTSEYYQ